MKEKDFHDQQDLAAWLKELPEGTSQAVAYRAAMRSLPKLWTYALAGENLTPLPYLRAGLLGSLAAVRPEASLQRVAAGAAFAPRANQAVDAGAAAAEEALHFALGTVASPDEAIPFAATAVEQSGYATSAVSSDDYLAWGAAEGDCRELAGGRPVESLPLWPNKNPFGDLWKDLRQQLLALDPGWPFWVRWYDKVLAAKPQDRKLLTDIALIPSEDWDKGPEHVNAIIAELQLKQAVAQTPNAEVISVNEATVRLRADPLSEMPRDHLEEAIEKLRNVVELFDPGTDWTNQHRAVEAERALIAEATEKYARRPRMLHWSCIRVIRRMDVKIRNGECPSQEQDADIADFYGTILAVSIDLYERDPMVREAVDHTASVRLRDVTPDEAQTIVRAADEVAAVSEDELATELPEQARAAVDPGTPPAERREALYITTSRMLRSYLILGWRGMRVTLEEIEGVSGTVAGICKNAAIIAGAGAAFTWPIWLKPAVDILLRLF